MALVLMATHGWGTLFIDPDDLEAGVGLQSSFTNPADATAVTHYADDAGASPSTGPVTADSNGRLMRWVEEGAYTQELPGGATLEVQAVSAVAARSVTDTVMYANAPLAGFDDVVGDGTTVNSTAIQGRVDALAAAGGGKLLFGPGTFIGHWEIPTGAPIQVEGIGSATIFKGESDSAADVISTEGVAALQDSGSSGGNYRCAVRDCVIDGNTPRPTVAVATVNFPVAGATINVTSTTGFPSTGSGSCQGNIFTYTGKTSTTLTGCTSVGATGVAVIGIGGEVLPYSDTSGRGLAMYGWHNQISNVIIQNCRSHGLYTGYGADVAGQGNTVEMTSSFENILCQNNAGDGWLFAGPHDSTQRNYQGFANSLCGFRNYYNPGGDNGEALHGHALAAYGNYQNGIKLTTGTIITDLQTSARVGVPGLLVDTGAGRCMLSQIIAAGDIGVEVKSGGHKLSGNIENNTAHGLKINGAANCMFDFVFGNNANAIRFESDAGGNFIYGKAITSGAQTITTGSISEATTVLVRGDGAAVVDIFRLPQSASLQLGSDVKIQRGAADLFDFIDLIRSSQTIAAGVGGGVQGFARLNPGGNPNSGYLEICKADGTRLGYIGSGATNLDVVLENSAALALSGGAMSFGAVTAASAPNNSIFRDSADNIIKIKDNGGTVRLLY